jgi:hypothetical protein
LICRTVKADFTTVPFVVIEDDHRRGHVRARHGRIVVDKFQGITQNDAWFWRQTLNCELLLVEHIHAWLIVEILVQCDHHPGFEVVIQCKGNVVAVMGSELEATRCAQGCAV